MGAIANPEAVLDVVSVVLPAADRTTTVTSAPIDCRGKSQVVFMVHYGVITDGTFTPSVTTSATSGGSYAGDTANLSGARTPGTSVADERTVVFTWNVDPAKPFCRLVLTASGSPEDGGEFSATALRLAGRYRP
jgi:hypothetical protein